MTRDVAALGVPAYRFAQFFFPIFLGGLAYASLRIGPWKIEKRDRLVRLRELARPESTQGESSIDFALRFGRRLTGLSPAGPGGNDPDDIVRMPADGKTSEVDGESPTETD
jgi:hypothetical protein